MAEILLQTKLIKPTARSSLITRPHLTAKLNAGLAGSVTLVSAPAGFGKTSLLSAWLASDALPAAWLALDDLDNDPARFLRYFVAALAKVMPLDLTLGEVLESEHATDPQLIFTYLLNSLAAQATQFVLVLEDFHVITNPTIVDGIAFLVDHAPPGQHLVITSRADPPMPLARWRVRGQLHEIRAADLRFRQDETTQMLQHMGLALTDDQLARLEARTEGWVAGLHLALLSLQHHPHVDQFIANFSGSHRFVMDYLTEEVLSHQPPEIEAFLLQTSLLDRFCAPLCDALRGGHGDSLDIIEQLDAANLFVVPLDARRTWYRFHHIFADLLRERLTQARSTDEIAEMHGRAAQWLATHDLVEEAIAHGTVSGAWEGVIDAIVRQSWAMFYQGRTNVVRGWLARLPTGMVRSTPRLALLQAWLLYRALNVAEVRVYLDAAQTLTDDAAHVAQCSVIHAWYAIATGDVRGGMAIAQASLSQLDSRAAEPLSAAHVDAHTVDAIQGALLTILSSGYFQLQQMDASVRTLEAALPLLARGQDWVGLADASSRLIHDYMMHGHLQLAYQSSLRFMQQTNHRPVMQIGGGLQAAAFHALVLFERYAVDELAEAERLAMRALELSRLSMSDAALNIWMRLFVALLKQVNGDVDGAHVLAQEAAAHLRQLATHPALVDHYDLLIRYYLLLDRNAAVGEWVARVAALDLPPDHAAMMRNRIRQAQYRLQTTPEDMTPEDVTALRDAQQQLQAIIATDPPNFTIMKAQAVLALLHDAMGEPDAARHALENALQLAAPEEWIQMFVYPGARMAKLVDKARPHSRVPAFCDAVAAALRTMLPAHSSPAHATPTPPAKVAGLLDPLTARELDVLQLLAQGKTNPEIAAALYIAVGTTKRHIANIYSKMAVGNRTEAATRARELGLLRD